VRALFRTLRALLRPPTRLEWSIAGRYLRSRRNSRAASLNTVISIGGVVVGVTALIVVLGVMNGLRNDLRERILVANPHLRILTYGAGLRVDDWRDALATVLKDPDVVAAAPEVITQSIITKGADYAEAINVLGFDPDTGRKSVTSLPQHITQGNLSFRTTRGVAVPKYWHFEVTGLFDTGMFQYDNQFVVMSRETAQRFNGLGDAVSGIAVRVKDPDRAPEVGARLERALRYPYRALDWQTQNQSLFSALQLEKLAMGLIIFFIMVVAAFNIVGTLTMVVADKTREIGILRAMGLTAPAVGRIFLVQGAIIGLVGTMIGLVLGLVVAFVVDKSGWVRIDPSVYFIDHLPIHVEATDALAVVLASVAVAVLATIHPSMTAARLTPVDAIRHE